VEKLDEKDKDIDAEIEKVKAEIEELVKESKKQTPFQKMLERACYERFGMSTMEYAMKMDEKAASDLEAEFAEIRIRQFMEKL
jgi:hypothetical protein